MSTRSKFERKLWFRGIGFAYKIPDVGRSLKPFDYVIGVPHTRESGSKALRLIAIEAKKATGWTMPQSYILPHQWKALDLLDGMAMYTSWIAVGFLDIPQMKLDWNRHAIDTPMQAEAYLIPWNVCKSLMGDGSLLYKDLKETLPKYIMDYGKIKTSYKWHVGKNHPFFSLIS